MNLHKEKLVILGYNSLYIPAVFILSLNHNRSLHITIHAKTSEVQIQFSLFVQLFIFTSRM